MFFSLAKLLVSSLVCFGLLSAWAATSPRHWFVRTGVLTGVLSLLLLIPAYEPVVVFALQGLTVAAGVQSYRWWKRRKEGRGLLPKKARFSLATVLLLTVYVAIAAAVISRMPEQEFTGWLVFMFLGIAMGIATLFGLWLANGRVKSKRQRLALGLLLLLSALLTLLLTDLSLSSLIFYDVPATIWILVNVCNTAFTGFLLWLWSGITENDSVWFCTRWKRNIARATLLLSTIAILAPSVSVYYQLMNPLPIPETVLPDPNGWDDIVAAGKLIENSSEVRTIGFYDTAAQDQLSVAVKAISPAYEQIAIGFEKQTHCPIMYTSYNVNTDVMAAIRNVARALVARGRLSELEGRFQESANSYLDCIRSGYATRQGGLIVDLLVGNACSGVGRSALYNIRDKLSASHCVSLASELGRLEKDADLVEVVLHRDRVMTQHAYGWQGHLWQVLGEEYETELRVIEIRKQERASMALLRLELAIQAWRLEHGELPESLNELVPEIIAEIPVDPFDPEGRLMRYLQTDEGNENGYILYSVGSNGVDDGGMPPDKDDFIALETGDLRLDVRYAPEPAVSEEEQEDLDENEVDE